MVTKTGAASNFLKPDVVKALRGIKVPQEIENPSNNAYPLSLKIKEYFKLEKTKVYDEIVDGTFVICPPEITKTKQGTSSSCWQNGFQLVMEKKNEEENSLGYHYTGYLIHHKEDKNGEYCGWLYRKQTVGVRTSDLIII